MSSKSGSTLEPNIFKQYFFERAQAGGRRAEAPKRFVAITDPGSTLEKLARDEGFRAVFHGVPSIGGRYSVLSNFGMVPAAAIGIEPRAFLESTAEMVRSCAPSAPPVGKPRRDPRRDHGRVPAPGPRQGHGHRLAGHRRFRRVARTASRRIDRQDRQGDRSGRRRAAGRARRFTATTGSSPISGSPRTRDAEQDKAVAALEAAGQPVVRIVVADPMQLGQEFFRWEMATAVAGSIIGINPFDQPDVEASKVETRKLTEAYEKTGKLPPEKPFFTGDGIELFADTRNEGELKPKATGPRRGAQGASRPGRGRRLRRAPRLYPARLRRISRRCRRCGGTSATRRRLRDLPRLRPALPALDRAGL